MPRTGTGGLEDRQSLVISELKTAACRYAMEKSSFWEGEARMERPQTPYCATIRQLASSPEWQPCLGLSRIMAVSPSTALMRKPASDKRWGTWKEDVMSETYRAF